MAVSDITPEMAAQELARRQAARSGVTPEMAAQELARRNGMTSPSTPFSGVGEAAAEGDGITAQDVKDFAVEEGPSLVGSIAGGVIGAAAGGPGGAIAGSMIGGAGGEAFKQLAQDAGILPGDAPATSSERASNIGLSGVLSGAGEGVGQVGTKAIKAAAAPFKGSLKPGAKEAFEQLQKTGATPTAGQLSDSGVLAFAENIAEYGFGGSGLVRSAREAAETNAEQTLLDFVDNFVTAGSAEEVGLAANAAIDGNREVFKSAARGMFGNVDTLTERAVVSIRPLKQFAQEKLAEMGQVTATESAVLKKLFKKDILGKPDAITFKEAQNLRSELAGIGRQANDPIPGKAPGRAKKATEILDDSMEASAQAIGGDVEQAWRAANKFWKDGHAKFNNELIKQLGKRDPDQFAKIALKPKKPVAIRKVKDAVGDPDVWESIKGHWVNDLLVESTDIHGKISGKKLVGKIKGFGDNAFNEVVENAGERANLKRFAQIIDVTQGPVAGGEGRMLIQMQQAQALQAVLVLGFAYDSGFDAKTAAILIAPNVMARALTNPKVIKWLSVGLQTGKGTKHGPGILAKISTALADDDIEHEIMPEYVQPSSDASPFSAAAKDIAATASSP